MNNELQLSSNNSITIKDWIDFKQFKKDIKNGKNINCTHLIFGYDFNQDIDINILPNTITHITFGNSFDKEIKPKALPKSLTHLVFGYNFNRILEKKSLPVSLTHLTFGLKYDRIIKPKVLPKSLIYLFFGHMFNQEIEENVLPKSLKYLLFGNYYDRKIRYDVLPKSLIHLNIGFLNDKKIGLPIYIENINELPTYVLPVSLEEITLGCNYNYVFNIKEYKLSNLKKINLHSYEYLKGGICINKHYFRNSFDKTSEIYLNKYKIKKYVIMTKNRDTFFKKYEKKYVFKISNQIKLIKKINLLYYNMENIFIEDIFVEKKIYEIPNKEKSFHQVRLNEIYEKILKYDDINANIIKKNLEYAKNMELTDNAIANTIENTIEKELKKEEEKHSDKQNYYENTVSKFRDIYDFYIDKNAKNKISINKYYIKNEAIKTEVVEFEHIYIQKRNTEYYRSNFYNNYAIEKIDNEIYNKIYSIFKEVPYVYVNETNEKKYILFYKKNINHMIIKDENIKPITDISISYIKNYEIKYQLNIFKYLLGNKYKLKYLVYYCLYFINNGKYIEESEIKVYKKSHNTMFVVYSICCLRTDTFIEENEKQFMNTIIKMFEYKIIVADELNKLYKLLIYCSIYNRMKKNKETTLDKITKYKNNYIDLTLIKNEKCKDTIISLYNSLCMDLKIYLCDLLSLSIDDTDKIHENINYIAY